LKKALVEGNSTHSGRLAKPYRAVWSQKQENMESKTRKQACRELEMIALKQEHERIKSDLTDANQQIYHFSVRLRVDVVPSPKSA
jgi:hypothetical protein